MPRIEFSQALHYAKEPKSAALQATLEAFFNKPDVQQKLTAVAAQVFPSNAPSPFSFGAQNMMMPLHDFLPTAESDGNPFNLCAAVLYALQETRNPKTVSALSVSATEGLKNIAGDMLTLVQSTPGENDLKTSILQKAENAVTAHIGRH